MNVEQYEAALKLSFAAMGQGAEVTVESVEKWKWTATPP